MAGGRARRFRKFSRQEWLTKTGHSDWDAPRVYQHDLADELEERGPQLQSAMVVVASDSEEPAVEERQDRRVVAGAPGGDTRVVIVHENPSPSGSVPIMPGRDIQFSEPAEVLPWSVEGRQAAETLEI